MTPKERIMAVLRHQKPDRMPVFGANSTVNYAQMEAVQAFWPEGHEKGEAMYKQALAAHSVLGFDAVRVPFCQTFEAEALGCKVKPGKGADGQQGIPGIDHPPPYKLDDEIEFPDDFLERGRIPELLKYARLMHEHCPDAWLFNFTNPAGLVTQALRDAGFERTIGICDSANLAQHAIATRLGVSENDLRPEVFGLNHLSWVRRINYQGADVLPRYLADPAFLSETIENVFDPALIHLFGMWLNEYLYYFYYAEQALAAISTDEKTRGEEIVALNRDLLAQLGQIDIENDLDTALRVYFRYNQRRESTYMHYAQRNAPTMQEADTQFNAMFVDVDLSEGEGYAGVALDLMEALVSGQPRYTALNVPNQGAIDGMQPDDVVEVSCMVDRHGPHPLSIGAIPASQRLLMQAVKHYERLTVRAIRERSRALGVQALMAHPLVLSYSRATALLDGYLQAHADYVGQWKA